MNLYQIRQQVRRLLRDDTYPMEDVTAAINRVIDDINSLGRFQFHETTYDITLVNGTASYTLPAYVLAPKFLIFDPGGTAERLVKFRSVLWEEDPLLPSTLSADRGDYPQEYSRYGSTVYFYPCPNATAATDVVRVYYDRDLLNLISELDTPTIPARYHATVLAYGAAAQLQPMLMISTPSGSQTIGAAYSNALRNMRNQENWRSMKISKLRPMLRFDTMNEWGNVTTLR
jgi:hypothetical protein